MAKKKPKITVDDAINEQDQIAAWLGKNSITKVDQNVGGDFVLKGFAARRNSFKKKVVEKPVKEAKISKKKKQ